MKKRIYEILSASPLVYILFLSFFIGGCLLPSRAASFFGGFASKENRYYSRQGKLEQLRMAGKYDELISEYLKDLENYKKAGNRYRQIETIAKINTVYVNNLKDYSKAIEYGEWAMQLVTAVEKTGVENEPDEHFFFVSAKEMEKRYQVSSKNQKKYGVPKGMPPTPLEKYGDQWIEKTKLEYYSNQKNSVMMSLYQAYKAIGNTKNRIST